MRFTTSLHGFWAEATNNLSWRECMLWYYTRHNVMIVLYWLVSNDTIPPPPILLWPQATPLSQDKWDDKNLIGYAQLSRSSTNQTASWCVLLVYYQDFYVLCFIDNYNIIIADLLTVVQVKINRVYSLIFIMCKKNLSYGHVLHSTGCTSIILVTAKRRGGSGHET